MIVSGAAPPMVDALRRVRRWMSRRVFCRFCHPRSRVPMVVGPFHYCAFCERAAPDAPETIDDQRGCTGCRYRTIYGGSRGSASLLWGLSSVDCGRGDYFIFLMRRSRDIAVMRKVLICLNALRRKLADQHASAERTLPCKALVTPSAQRVAEWKKKAEKVPKAGRSDLSRFFSPTPLRVPPPEPLFSIRAKATL